MGLSLSSMQVRKRARKGVVGEAEHDLVSRSREKDLALAGQFTEGVLENGQNYSPCRPCPGPWQGGRLECPEPQLSHLHNEGSNYFMGELCD